MTAHPCIPFSGITLSSYNQLKIIPRFPIKQALNKMILDGEGGSG